MQNQVKSEYDNTNIFGRVLRGEIPSHKVYEDDVVVAIMDVMPQADGHVLVIPKLPSRNLLDADPSVLGPALAVAQRIGKAQMAAFAAHGVMLVQYNEASAGQSVFHLHFHVIPRHEGVALKGHSGKMEEPDMLAANADKLRAALQAV